MTDHLVGYFLASLIGGAGFACGYILAVSVIRSLHGAFPGMTARHVWIVVLGFICVVTSTWPAVLAGLIVYWIWSRGHRTVARVTP